MARGGIWVSQVNYCPSKFFEINILRVAARKNAKNRGLVGKDSQSSRTQVALSLYSAIFCAQMAPAPIKIVSLLRVSNNSGGAR